MKDKSIIPTTVERAMRDGDFIVSKTNSKGQLTFCNRIFIEFSGYTEDELLGQQHNIIRHPGMPRSVFKLLWARIQSGEEIFAYVKNMHKDGGYYWVYANVTASRDMNGNIIGFYSVRRKPSTKAMSVIPKFYDEILAEEQRHATKDQLNAGAAFIEQKLSELGTSYDHFVYQLQG